MNQYKCLLKLSVVYGSLSFLTLLMDEFLILEVQHKSLWSLRVSFFVMFPYLVCKGKQRTKDEQHFLCCFLFSFPSVERKDMG